MLRIPVNTRAQIMSNQTWGLLILGALFLINGIVIVAATLKTRTPPNRYRADVLPKPQAAAVGPRHFADT